MRMQKSKQLTRMKEGKARLIARYMKLQDQADKTNERIYSICCDIEKANMKIQKEEERLKRKADEAAAKKRKLA